MKKLKQEETKQITGGAVSYTSAINAVIKAITTLFSVGQAVGSALRRVTSGSYCKT